MAFKMSFKLQVTRSEFMSNPATRWQNALAYAGQGWASEMQNYPPENPDSTYMRTMNLAKHASFRVTSATRCDLIAPDYAAYLLLGTGIYGPRGAPITGNMWWQATKGPQAGTWIHANSIRGTIWPGKLDAVKKAIEDGFKEGLRRR